MNQRDMTRGHHNPERGFALLLVFAMAAIIAILLYSELPRAVFESARAKEELLVERGGQYTRAIGLYYRRNKRFPQRIEDLEASNGIRYLRRKYLDPFTGKDEWRLIHVGPMGELIDSKVQKPGGLKEEKAENRNTLVGEGYQVGGGGGGPQEQDRGQSSIAMRQRPGDKGPPPGGTANELPNNFDPNAATQPPPPQPPSTVTGVPGGFGVPTVQINPAQQGYPQQVILQQPQGFPPPAGSGINVPQQYPPGIPYLPSPQSQAGNAGQAGQPGYQTSIPSAPAIGAPYQPQNQFNPNQTNQQQPGQQQVPGGYNGPPGFPSQPVFPNLQQQPGRGQPFPVGQTYPVQPVNAQAGGYSTNPFPAQQGQQGFPGQQVPRQQAPGQQGLVGIQPGANNAAIDLIRNIIQSPRQQPGIGSSVGTGQTLGGGGIVGIASKAKGEGIKLINERSKIEEWEFIYDPKKDKAVVGAAAAAGGLPGQNVNPNPANPANPQRPNNSQRSQ